MIRMTMLIGALLPLPAVAADALVGRASITDGDSLEIHGTRVRLHGIDAPESTQSCTRDSGQQWPCGRRAAAALDAHIASRPVTCKQQDVDRYGRVVAECFVGGQSLNQWQVRQGWAIAYRQYSDQYIADEEAARRERRNIWAERFTTPAQYRRTRDRPAQATPAGCNINANGDRIYHAPGQRHYEGTRIDVAAGERWFCRADDARSAGWRATNQ